MRSALPAFSAPAARKHIARAQLAKARASMRPTMAVSPLARLGLGYGVLLAGVMGATFALVLRAVL